MVVGLPFLDKRFRVIQKCRVYHQQLLCKSISFFPHPYAIRVAGNRLRHQPPSRTSRATHRIFIRDCEAKRKEMGSRGNRKRRAEEQFLPFIHLIDFLDFFLPFVFFSSVREDEPKRHRQQAALVATFHITIGGIITWSERRATSLTTTTQRHTR